MLFFGPQVIAVILAVFLHHGNGRAITSTSNDNIERMLSLVEEELNNKGSDNVTLPMAANPVWRHKRSLDDEPECYTGVYNTINLKHAGLITYPECRPVAQHTACSSSMPNNGNKRKCVPSNYVAYPKDNATIPTACSCAP